MNNSFMIIIIQQEVNRTRDTIRYTTYVNIYIRLDIFVGGGIFKGQFIATALLKYAKYV